MRSDLVLEIPVRYVIWGRYPSLTTPSPTPPRGPGGIRAALCALGDAARDARLHFLLLLALIIAFAKPLGERAHAAIVSFFHEAAP